MADLRDPTSAALLVAEALERARIPHALYGGLLLAAYGEPRETRDVDLAVVDTGADVVAVALRSAGVDTAPVFSGLRVGGLALDRLTLLGGDADVGLNSLDLVRPRSARFAAAALRRAIVAPLRDRTIRVLSPEDFVLFKLLSTRARDLDDARSVLSRLDDTLDRAMLDEEIPLLSSEIADHDIRARWAVASA